MMSENIYPTEKEELLKILSKDDLQKIQKYYPFKKKRDEKIYELIHENGVSCQVLAGLCGLAKSSVHRIGQRGHNGNNGSYLTNNEKNLRNYLNKMQTTVEAFHREIKRILRHGRK
ncbi:MAG: hypothetical protein K4571_12115 [Deltaproteobacteria bacterium]